MSVAERIADERDQRLGESVGYQIRLESKLPATNNSILLCTTGLNFIRQNFSLGTQTIYLIFGWMNISYRSLNCKIDN